MKNQELIKRCRERISGEDEPHSMEWLDMVEALCNALEKSDKENEGLEEQVNDLLLDLNMYKSYR